MIPNILQSRLLEGCCWRSPAYGNYLSSKVVTIYLRGRFVLVCFGVRVLSFELVEDIGEVTEVGERLPCGLFFGVANPLDLILNLP